MLSNQSVNTIMDLLQNRLSAMEITDREDLREATIMKRALAEIARLTGHSVQGDDFLDVIPRRGRKRKLLNA